jgi:hypothetical protein
MESPTARHDDPRKRTPHLGAVQARIKSEKSNKKGLTFTTKPVRLFPVMRDMTKTKKKFLNVVFNVKRNAAYKGNHELARTDRIHTTFPLGTTEQDMIKEFHAELVNIDINGKTWLKGEMIQVTSIDNCFEDKSND